SRSSPPTSSTARATRIIFVSSRRDRWGAHLSRSSDKPRCRWPGSDPLYIEYHDHEWGVPLKDDRALFEMLMLEGAQAGLSWITILRKRENYRRAFDGFEPAKIARYTPAKIEKLMADEGIVRNRLKIEGVVLSAKAYLAMQKEGLSFS